MFFNHPNNESNMNALWLDLWDLGFQEGSVSDDPERIALEIRRANTNGTTDDGERQHFLQQWAILCIRLEVTCPIETYFLSVTRKNTSAITRFEIPEQLLEELANAMQEKDVEVSATALSAALP